MADRGIQYHISVINGVFILVLCIHCAYNLVFHFLLLILAANSPDTSVPSIHGPCSQPYFSIFPSREG